MTYKYKLKTKIAALLKRGDCRLEIINKLKQIDKDIRPWEVDNILEELKNK